MRHGMMLFLEFLKMKEDGNSKMVDINDIMMIPRHASTSSSSNSNSPRRTAQAP
jgi:hypothetical protein